jgi:hypothetical protein
LPAKLRAGITGKLHAFVADGKPDRIAAALGEIGALSECGLRLRCISRGFLRRRSTSREDKHRDEQKGGREGRSHMEGIVT